VTHIHVKFVRMELPNVRLELQVETFAVSQVRSHCFPLLIAGKVSPFI